MKKKLFFISMICFFISIGDVYPTDSYSADHDSEIAAKKRRKSKRKSKKRGADDTKGFVALSGGISMPMGDFADASLTFSVPTGKTKGELTAPCKAEMGFMYNATFGYRFTDYIGAMGMVQGQSYSATPESNPMVAGKGALADLKMKVQLQEDSWGMWLFMAGPNFHMPLGKKSPFSFEAKVLLGMARVTSPSFNIETYYEGTNWYDKFGTNGVLPMQMKTSSYTTSSFAYLIGIGARYDIGSMFCLLLNFDYLGTTPTFSIQNNDREQSIGTFNINAGFGIRF